MGARRRGAVVVVDGWGPVCTELVAQLRRCGTPVHGGRQAADAAELELDSGGCPPGVVVVVQDSPPRWGGEPWQSRGIRHLPVTVDARSVTVGPLVVPGLSACLGCVTRGSVAWPGPPVAPPSAPRLPAEAVVLAAAVASVTVLTALRGDPTLAGISTELSLDKMSVMHRLWQPRHGCECASVRMVG